MIFSYNRYLPYKLFVAVVLLFLMVGCSDFTAGKGAAEVEISKFHTNYNNGDFEAIYQNAHKEFKKVSIFEDFKEFMTAVHRKLGMLSSTSTQNWNLNTYNFVTKAVMVQETKFEHGTGIETFTFRIKGEKALLVGYNVNSRALILK